MTWARLGPLGGLRDIPNPTPETVVESSRAENPFPLLGGYMHVQRSPRRSRAWRLGHIWQAPERLAYLTACAEGAIPGPLYLHTQDAALTNLLPSDVAAPCRMGTAALGTVAGTVAVGMPGGVVSSSGVVQQASAGAWSRIVPVRQVLHTLSVWASAAGAAVEWRTVTAAGAQVATGTVTAAAVAGGFRGVATFTPGVTAAGVQVRTSAGSRTVGGLRLTEGWDTPHPGVEARRNLRTRPSTTAALAVAASGGAGPWGGTAPTVSQVADAAAPSGGGYCTRLTNPVSQTCPVGGDAATGGPLAEPVTPGSVRTVSVYVRCSTALSVRPQIQWLTAGGGSAGTSPTTPAVALAPGAWTRLSVTATAPATAASSRVDVDFAASQTLPAGMTLDLDAVLVEAAASLGPYFDGSTSPDPTLIPSWTGTPNASPSILSETLPADTAPDWLPGVGVPQVVVSDPQQTLQLVTSTETLSDYTVTIREVGA